MRYLIEQFKWEEEDGIKYYHLVNSKEFESSRVISNHSYHKNGSYFIIRQIDDFQNKPKLKQRGKILK